jgi:hypothetical protein
MAKFPSFIGASCSTHVLESVITTNSIHCANHFFPRLRQPLVEPDQPSGIPTPLHPGRRGGLRLLESDLPLGRNEDGSRLDSSPRLLT